MSVKNNGSYSDDSLFSITSWGADLTFRDLIQRYDDDELLKPELQRNYVWDRVEASRFIDSLLLGLPVPSIFLAKAPEEKLLIVDGYQRIMTVYDFVRGIFTQDGKIFNLSISDKINTRWRGKAFSELTDQEQRRIRNTTIHAIIFEQQKPDNDDTSLFQIFERINTSGRTLLPQEIRNCVAQGSLNTLLIELNEQPQWRELYGKNEPDSRMRDMEHILRFFALSSERFRQNKGERILLKKFLDLYMKANANLGDSTLDILRNRFARSIELIHATFGTSAYHNVSPSDSSKLVKRFSPTIFDSITIAADYALSVGSMKIPRNAETVRVRLLRNKDYHLAISKETMTRTSIMTRVGKACLYLLGVKYE